MAARSDKTPTSFKFFPPKKKGIIFVVVFQRIRRNDLNFQIKKGGISSLDFLEYFGCGRMKLMSKKPQSNPPLKPECAEDATKQSSSSECCNGSFLGLDHFGPAHFSWIWVDMGPDHFISFNTTKTFHNL